MVESLAAEAKRILAQLGVAARKKLGQNFMVDEAALEQIASAIPLTPGETVLEIGPGIGFLTRSLLRRGVRVTAIEKDEAYAAFLPDYFLGKPLTVIKQDFLSFDLSAHFGANRGKVFGNIPYNITSPILEKLTQARSSVSDAVLTTQWEVAERIHASPGNKIWGPLSIFVQFYADVKIIRRIDRSAFSPAPKVHSAVLHLHYPNHPRWNVKNERLFFQIVRRAFLKRRKTLLNALEGEGPFFSKARLRDILDRVCVDAGRRPETLSLEEWARLTDEMASDGTP